ncbi:MAG: hypothetical protein WA980_04395 [Shinella zoogloeoides]|uniref:hypothetical protein n=1 Tax=Shinella zoogloeoides TaxID=352475 RepID=UPI003C761501
MLKLIDSLQINAPFESYPIVEEYGAFKLQSVTTYSTRGISGQDLLRETFSTKQEALDFISKRRERSKAVLVITHLSDGRIDFEAYA